MNALQIAVPSTLRDWLAKSSFDSRTRERCWKKLARQLRHTHLSLEHCFRILQERAKKEKKSSATSRLRHFLQPPYRPRLYFRS